MSWPKSIITERWSHWAAVSWWRHWAAVSWWRWDEKTIVTSIACTWSCVESSQSVPEKHPSRCHTVERRSRSSLVCWSNNRLSQCLARILFKRPCVLCNSNRCFEIAEPRASGTGWEKIFMQGSGLSRGSTAQDTWWGPAIANGDRGQKYREK